MIQPLTDVRLQNLLDECDTLRERIRQLEVVLGVRMKAPVEFRLTATEAKLFGLLFMRDIITAESAIIAMYSHLADEYPDFKIVDVLICKLRKKIAPFGISIETVWGQGYRIPPASKAKVRKMLQSQASITLPPEHYQEDAL